MSFLQYCCPKCGHSTSPNNNACVWCDNPIDKGNIETLISVHEERYDLASNATSSSQLEELACDKSLLVRGAVARNPRASSDTLAALFEAIRDEDALFVLEDPENCHPVRARAFECAKEEYQEILRSIAKNPSTPAYALRELAGDANLTSFVAKNPNAPADFLQSLSSSPSVGDRWSVAENPNTPTNILCALANDTSERVRMGVAKNPCAPEDLLRMLASDSSSDVLSSIAANPGTPIDVLEMLATNPNSWVRCSAESYLQSRKSIQ